jgi:hypothetical protein
MQTTVVYDAITGRYIERVPIYKAGDSCAKSGRRHVWILNSAHKKVCIRCGLVSRITSFYKFAMEVGILDSKGLGSHKKTRRRLA